MPNQNRVNFDFNSGVEALEVFCKKGVYKNFGKFAGKHFLVFEEIVGLRPAILIKKIPTQMFFYKFCEIFKYTFFIEHFWWLLLVVKLEELLLSIKRNI